MTLTAGIPGLWSHSAITLAGQNSGDLDRTADKRYRNTLPGLSHTILGEGIITSLAITTHSC